MNTPIQIFQDIILGRSKQFIELFNSIDSHKLDCEHCSFSPNSYFLCAYGLKILLDDDSWNAEYKPIISHFREENEIIWNFMVENKLIPVDYHKEFIDYAKTFASESINYSYEDIFFAPLETLIKNGATQLDLDLYRASASLEFEETERLLKLGANPDKDILIRESDDDEFPETWSCLGDIAMLWNNAYESGLDLHLIWKKEYEEDVKNTLPPSLFCKIIISAAYKLMYELLENHNQNYT